MESKIWKFITIFEVRKSKKRLRILGARRKKRQMENFLAASDKVAVAATWRAVLYRTHPFGFPIGGCRSRSTILHFFLRRFSLVAASSSPRRASSESLPLRLAFAQLFARTRYWALHSTALLDADLLGWCTRNATEGSRHTPGTTEVGYQHRACSCNGHLGFDALARLALCACTILHEWLSRPGARGVRPWPGCT